MQGVTVILAAPVACVITSRYGHIIRTNIGLALLLNIAARRGICGGVRIVCPRVDIVRHVLGHVWTQAKFEEAHMFCTHVHFQPNNFAMLYFLQRNRSRIACSVIVRGNIQAAHDYHIFCLRWHHLRPGRCNSCLGNLGRSTKI